MLNHDFVTRRLAELPPASRVVLAWASLLGTTFSFELLQRLLSGEFDYDDDNSNAQNVDQDALPEGAQRPLIQSQADTVAGLQAAIQAYIIVATDSDDKFRFAHDRYIQASADLEECNPPAMHFVLAQVFLEYYADDLAARDNTAAHICEALPMLIKRVPVRAPFRKVLLGCAQSANDSGARPTAAK